MQRFVLSSNHVFLSEDAPDTAAALLVEGDKIVQVTGADAAAELASSHQVALIDYGDALITPGLHDAHEHVMHAALFPSELADEYCGISEADCVAHVASFAAAHPTEGWIISHGWRDALWAPSKPPTRHSLDKVFPDRPVAMYSGDSHTLWLNSCGLAELGLNRDSEPPAGGSFDRDSSGELTGVIREAAGMIYVARVLESIPRAELTSVYRTYFARLSSLGITSVCDMALSLIPGTDSIYPDIYQALERSGELNVRAHLFPTLSDDESNLEQLQATLTGPMLRAPGFKQFFDGVSSQHTAWCSEPYANARFAGDKGRPTVAPERMRELVLAAASRGHAVRIHAIGDQAVHSAIDIFTEARSLYGAPQVGRNAIEHAEDIQPKDISRLAAADIVASVQPPHVTIDLAQPARDLGEERASRMWPFRQMHDAGVVLALGTDAPVVGPDSGDVLYTAIVRKTPSSHEPEAGWYPEHALTRVQTIAAYTAGSAYAVGRESELGTLAPGQFADIVAWDTNLLTCSESELQTVRPTATYVGGRKVFSAH